MRRPSGFADQPELHGIPVEPRQLLQRAELERTLAAAAIGGHVIAECGVREHGYVAEHVVEDIRFLQIIELVRLANEVARNEAPVGQMVEKHIVRYQSRAPPPPASPVAAISRSLSSAKSGMPGFDSCSTSSPFRNSCEARPGSMAALAREQLVPGGVLLVAIGVPTLAGWSSRARRPPGGVSKT